MLNLGTPEEAANAQKNITNHTDSTSDIPPPPAPPAAPSGSENAGSYSNQPPPQYGSAPPSYGYQGPPPSYGGGRPPSYGRGGGYGGGPRRGGWGGAPPMMMNLNNNNNNNGPMPPNIVNQQDGNSSEGTGSDQAREPNINQAKFKTRICANFMNGQCTWGNNCAFAHGDYEMRLGSPNTGNGPAGGFPPSEGQQHGNPQHHNRGDGRLERMGSLQQRQHNGGVAPPPSYGRTMSSQQNGVPPPYHSSPTKNAQRTPPPVMVPPMSGGGFPQGGPNYVSSPISPRSPMKLSSPTGTSTRFRHEPYSALGKAFSSDNLQGLGSGHPSPRGEAPAAPAN